MVIAGIPITWLRQNDSVPTWNREARLSVRHLIGTNQSAITYLGQGPRTITGETALTATDAQTLQALNGHVVTVVDGSSSVQAVLQIALRELVGGNGYIASITLMQV
jgi:hypothetical protein